jgi:hypothetical protein
LEPEPSNAPRRAREKLRRTLILAGVAAGVLIPLAMFVLFTKLGT